MEKKCGRGYGATRFGQRLRVRTQSAHGLADLVFGHAYDVIDISADVFEIDRADALGAKTVCECLRDLLRRGRDDAAGTQAGLRIGGKFGLDANTFTWGLAKLG